MQIAGVFVIIVKQHLSPLSLFNERSLGMNPYLQPQGFLGTGASLLADLTLLAYVVLLVPGMIAGLMFARRGKFRPNHKYTMMTITTINWVLIIFLMLVAYTFDIAGNIGQKPTTARYLIPTIHGILGLVAQVLATYVIYRMLREESQVAAAKKRGEAKEKYSRFYFTSAKYFMRTILTLWLITALLGIFNYLIRYDVLPSYSGNQPAPAVTQEPSSTQEVVTTEAPAVTPEATP
jgi:uncharacterized membrane protein YozB (DUF420 family)